MLQQHCASDLLSMTAGSLTQVATVGKVVTDFLYDAFLYAARHEQPRLHHPRQRALAPPPPGEDCSWVPPISRGRRIGENQNRSAPRPAAPATPTPTCTYSRPTSPQTSTRPGKGRPRPTAWPPRAMQVDDAEVILSDITTWDALPQTAKLTRTVRALEKLHSQMRQYINNTNRVATHLSEHGGDA